MRGVAFYLSHIIKLWVSIWFSSLVDTRQPVCSLKIFQSLITYLMPVSRLPWQRVYAGSTSLFEYPIGPFLLFRALALSSHRPSLWSLSELLCIILYFHAIQHDLSFAVYFLCQLLFLPGTFPRLAVCVSSASLPCLTVSPVILPLNTSSPDSSSTCYSHLVRSALWCATDLNLWSFAVSDYVSFFVVLILVQSAQKIKNFFVLKQYITLNGW